MISERKSTIWEFFSWFYKSKLVIVIYTKMTMDESLPSVGAVPPNLREDLERREIEASIIWNLEVAKRAHDIFE